MDKSELNIIKTRTISLRVGQLSDNVVLVDNIGGNMYFTFKLNYVQGDETAQTHVSVKDEYRADIVIDTTPDAVARLNSPILIGTYARNKELYFDYRVEPVEGDSHTVVITFLTN